MEEETVSKEIPPSKVQTVEGHTKKVFSCCWNPRSSVLATGFVCSSFCSPRSADSTVHLWDVLPTSEDGTSAMETKPGAVLSHSVPADGENIITSIAWNVPLPLFLSQARWNVARDRLLRRRGEVLERGIHLRCHRVSPKSPRFQRLLFPLRYASSRHRLSPFLLRLSLGLGRRFAGSCFSVRKSQEFDTLAINDAEKQLGSTTTLSSNSRRVVMSTRSGSSGERVARRRQFLLHRQPESHRERESPSDESATPHPGADGTRSRGGGDGSDRER